MIPAVSSLAYDAARHRSAFIDRSHRGRIVVSGADRASYLQGLLTNDIVALKAEKGCYAAYLTAQGRMIADMYVYELGDVILLTLAGRVKDTVLAKLEWFRLGGESSERQWWDIVGVLKVTVGADRTYLRRWARRLGVTDLLERALADADG